MIAAVLLFSLGILGIVAENLWQINKLNQENNGTTDLKHYLKRNWAQAALSFCLVMAFVVGREFIPELKKAGMLLGAGLFLIGMAGPTAAGILRDFAASFFKALLPKIFKT